MNLKRNINIWIIIICFILLSILAIITFQAVTQTENPSLFIDFEDNKKTISSYGSLISGVVALLSAILLIYTILTQLYQFKKQNKQFKKQFKLQQDQFNEDKKRAEYEEKKDMYFKLKLVDVFLISIIVHIKVMSIEMKKYFEFEKTYPMLNNVLQFDVNKDTDRLNKMDNLSLFKTFQHFFENDNESWVKNFNDLFSIITFYNDLLEEIFVTTKNHIQTKYERKVAISFDLKTIMDKTRDLIIKYRTLELDIDQLPYNDYVEELIGNYNDYLKYNEKEKKEADFNDISQNILLPFLENVVPISKERNYDDKDIEELLHLISSIRKIIYVVRIDSLDYANSITNRYNEYFSEESEQLRNLEEIQKIIHSKLSTLSLQNL